MTGESGLRPICTNKTFEQILRGGGRIHLYLNYNPLEAPAVKKSCLFFTFLALFAVACAMPIRPRRQPRARTRSRYERDAHPAFDPAVRRIR
jgi:hypothetical protein